MTRAALLAATVALFGVACIDGSGEEDFPSGDFDFFVQSVEPVLEARCANPSCHGSGARPLSLYAPGVYRLDENDTFLRQPLHQAELRHNQLRAAAFVADLGEESTLLKKPIPVEHGGVEHKGGVIFASTDEPAYRSLVAWVATVLEEAP